MNIDHIVLNVVDIKESVKFYTQIMGFQVERLDDYLSGKAAFPFVRISKENIIDLFPREMWQKNIGSYECLTTNLNHFCLACSREAWEALKNRLESNGINIESGPVKRGGALGDGVSIYFRDPDNNLIEVRYYD